jgi:hypothetical protein
LCASENRGLDRLVTRCHGWIRIQAKIKRFNYAALTFAVVRITPITLKFTWYDRLSEHEEMPVEAEKVEPVVLIASRYVGVFVQ